MKIHLPNSAFLHNIDGFLRKFDPTNPDILKITANKNWISVHPLCIAMVAALGLKAGTVECESFEAKSKHYFERIGLFKIVGIESGITFESHEESGRFIPVIQIITPEEQSKFIQDIIPMLHLQKKYQRDTIVYVLGELIRNVIEHARTPKGAIVCAQYHKKNNKIRIGIADTGIGIKSSITPFYPQATSDLSAIQLALWPGITGTTENIGGTEQNFGAGLFFTKSIAKANGDFFMIYSGDSMYKLLREKLSKRLELNIDPFLDVSSRVTRLPYWQGTIVGIDITLDQTNEFDSLLLALNQTLNKAIRDRKRPMFRKPKFV